MLSDINRNSVFLGQSPKATEIKTKINKQDLIRFTSFCTAKKVINKRKRPPTEWEKISANKVTDKDLISKIQTTPTTQQKKKQTTQSKNGRRPK